MGWSLPARSPPRPARGSSRRARTRAPSAAAAGCSVERVPYVVDQALGVLAGLKHIILVGAKMPVAFFAYPDKPSLLTPPDCAGHVLARPDEDLIARARSAGRGGRRAGDAGAGRQRGDAGAGDRRDHVGGARRSIGALLPENAIVVDEAVTTGRGFFAPTQIGRAA